MCIICSLSDNFFYFCHFWARSALMFHMPQYIENRIGMSSNIVFQTSLTFLQPSTEYWTRITAFKILTNEVKGRQLKSSQSMNWNFLSQDRKSAWWRFYLTRACVNECLLRAMSAPLMSVWIAWSRRSIAFNILFRASYCANKNQGVNTH